MHLLFILPLHYNILSAECIFTSDITMLSRITSSTSSDQFGEVIEDKHKIAEGILAVNILSCSLPSYLKLSTQPVLEVGIGVKKKSADICFKEGDETGADTSKKIFHFQVEVPHCALERSNLISIRLFLRGQETDTLGLKYLHLHDVIRDTPLQGKLDIRSAADDLMAQINVAIVFTYGLFGYSESYHLEDFPGVAGYTLFPRIESQDERYNHTGRVINPKQTARISLIPSSSLVPPSSPVPPSLAQYPLLTAAIGQSVKKYRGMLDSAENRNERISMLKKWARE